MKNIIVASAASPTRTMTSILAAPPASPKVDDDDFYVRSKERMMTMRRMRKISL